MEHSRASQPEWPRAESERVSCAKGSWWGEQGGLTAAETCSAVMLRIWAFLRENVLPWRGT